MKTSWLCHLGLTPYKKVWELQKELVLKRQKDEIPDTLLLCEHPPTYTLGKSGKTQHLLADEKILKEIGAEFIQIDRGGDITFHGPGQLVAYPVLKLKEFQLDVHQYLRALEKTTIQALSQYGIQAGQLEGLTGVWVDEAKIAAIGVRLSRWVSMHGIAVNISPDLNYFKHIIPCGISSKSVTSLKEILKRDISVADFSKNFVSAFENVFSVALKEKPITAIQKREYVKSSVV